MGVRIDIVTYMGVACAQHLSAPKCYLMVSKKTQSHTCTRDTTLLPLKLLANLLLASMGVGQDHQEVNHIMKGMRKETLLLRRAM